MFAHQHDNGIDYCTAKCLDVIYGWEEGGPEGGGAKVRHLYPKEGGGGDGVIGGEICDI